MDNDNVSSEFCLGSILLRLDHQMGKAELMEIRSHILGSALEVDITKLFLKGNFFGITALAIRRSNH